MKEVLENNNEPIESKGIRLVELGELDNVDPIPTVNFSDIEKNLIDKRSLTMRERIEYLIKQVQKLELRRANETDEDIQAIIDEKLTALKKELYDLQEKLQPQRFEQVLELIISKCQDIIDSNEIFIDGDKDIFLNRFVEPYLKSYNVNIVRDTTGVRAANGNQLKSVMEELQNDAIRKKADHTKLKVTFPDGQIINDNEAIDTFIKTLDLLGFEKIHQLAGDGGPSIISDRPDNGLKKEFKRIPNTPFYINSNNSTEAKKKLIEKVGSMLRTEIKVEIEPKY